MGGVTATGTAQRADRGVQFTHSTGLLPLEYHVATLLSRRTGFPRTARVAVLPWVAEHVAGSICGIEKANYEWMKPIHFIAIHSKVLIDIIEFQGYKVSLKTAQEEMISATPYLVQDKTWWSQALSRLRFFPFFVPNSPSTTFMGIARTNW